MAPYSRTPLLLALLALLLSPVVHAESKTVTVRSEAEIRSVLELTISEQGESELRFGNIRPSPTAFTEAGPVSVLINIRCNTGQPYQVTQTINNPLENGSGDTIGPENLSFRSVSQKALGNPVDTYTTVIPAGTQTIYVSDPSGTSDTISAQYLLRVPPAQAPGDYSAVFTFTTSAI